MIKLSFFFHISFIIHQSHLFLAFACSYSRVFLRNRTWSVGDGGTGKTTFVKVSNSFSTMPRYKRNTIWYTIISVIWLVNSRKSTSVCTDPILLDHFDVIEPHLKGWSSTRSQYSDDNVLTTTILFQPRSVLKYTRSHSPQISVLSCSIAGILLDKKNSVVSVMDIIFKDSAALSCSTWLVGSRIRMYQTGIVILSVSAKIFRSCFAVTRSMSRYCAHLDPYENLTDLALCRNGKSRPLPWPSTGRKTCNTLKFLQNRITTSKSLSSGWQENSLGK
jgi:hypothetical protein